MQDNPTDQYDSAHSEERPSTPLTGVVENETSFEDLKRKAADDLDMVKDKAKEQIQGVAEKAEQAAADHKNVAARYAASLGAALQKVGAEMQNSDDTEISKYAEDLGTSIQSFARDVEDKKLRDVAAMAEDFGRRQPLAFLGAAALAGLVASRFLTASAPKEARETGGSNKFGQEKADV
jgi:hypothetical protein